MFCNFILFLNFSVLIHLLGSKLVTYVNTCIYVYEYICASVCKLYISKYVYVCKCKYIFICIYVYIYIYILTSDVTTKYQLKYMLKMKV